MTVLDKLQGTTLEDWQIGHDETHGVKRLDGEIALYDPINNAVKLSELAGVTVVGHPFKVANGGSITVPTDRQFDHIGRFQVDGRLVINGRFVLGMGTDNV